MNSKMIGILVVVAGGLGVSAWVSTSLRESADTKTSTPATQAKLFDGLSDKLGDVASIEVKGATQHTTLKRETKDKDTTWVLPDKGNFPADTSKVVTALRGIADLRILDPKTSKPELYTKIGVDEPGKPNSTSTLVTLKSDAGVPLASLIVGNAGDPGAMGSENETTFVRKAGEAQAYLVKGAARFDADSLSWSNRTVLELDRNRVSSVTMKPASGDLGPMDVVELYRDTEKAADFTVRNLPPGRQLKSEYAPDQPGGALSYVSIDNVKPASEVDFTKSDDGYRVTTDRFATFDGLVITVNIVKHDSQHWARFSAAYDEAAVAPPIPTPPSTPDKPAPPEPNKRKTADEVKKEAEDLNKRFNGWAFGLPEFNAKQLATKLDELLKDEDKPKDDGKIGPPLPGNQPIGPTFPPQNEGVDLTKPGS